MKYVITLNDKKYEVDVTETDAVITGVSAAVQAPAAPAAMPAPAQAAAPAQTAAPAPTADGVKVKAPMPGTILEVKAAVGQPVKAGDVLFILEAMKMENEVVAPQDGTVKQVLAAKGAAVDTDAILAVI